MTVVLLAFWSSGQLFTWWQPPSAAITFAVMLAVAVPRALRRMPTADLGLAGAGLGVGVAAATGCDLLVGLGAWWLLGAALFALGVAVPVWVRRFGPAWRNAGTVAALPFMAVLVSPEPARASWDLVGWMLVAAALAACWSLAVRVLAGDAPAPRPPDEAVRPSPARRRVSTKMAVQLGVAVLATFAVGRWSDPGHLVWPVLTVLVVHSGNRGRGDVVRKGGQRIVGALAGTGVATLLAGVVGPGDPTAVVAVFAVLALAAFGRELGGYVYWAAGVTAALAFLYGFYGQGGASMLGHRLGGIAAGGVIAVAAAWWVWPVRTPIRRTRQP